MCMPNETNCCDCATTCKTAELYGRVCSQYEILLINSGGAFEFDSIEDNLEMLKSYRPPLGYI